MQGAISPALGLKIQIKAMQQKAGNSIMNHPALLGIDGPHFALYIIP